AGLDPSRIWLVLMVSGIGSVAGNWFGGRLADRNLEFGVLFALLMIATALTAFYFTSTHPVLGVINLGLVAFFGNSLVRSLQIRLMDVAGDAQTLAAALNHSALNLANAAGAAIGGMVISAGFSYSAPALAGTALALAAVGVWVPTFFLRRRYLSSIGDQS